MELEEVEVRPETLEDFTIHHHATIQRVARATAAKYRTLDAEDLEQGLWEEVLNTFEKAFQGVEPEQVRKRLYRIASRLQNRESLDYMHFTGAYLYTPEEVRMKLASCAWSDLDECPDVDARVDLRGAVEQLGTKQREAVHKRYALGQGREDLSDSEWRNAYLAVDNITHYLNRNERIVTESYEALRDEELSREGAFL